MSEQSPAAIVHAEGGTRRQAIVLIHGMGEQTPMETVRDFADATWTQHPDIHDPASTARTPGEIFFVPDPNSGSRELRRISTRKSRRRADPGKPYQVQ